MKARLMRCAPAYQLVEITLLSVLGFLLINQCQTLLFELLEPLVPGNLLKLVVAAVAGKIQANDAWIILAAGAAHTGWLRPTRLRSLANGIVVGGSQACHKYLLAWKALGRNINDNGGKCARLPPQAPAPDHSGLQYRRGLPRRPDPCPGGCREQSDVELPVHAYCAERL